MNSSIESLSTVLRIIANTNNVSGTNRIEKLFSTCETLSEEDIRMAIFDLGMSDPKEISSISSELWVICKKIVAHKKQIIDTYNKALRKDIVSLYDTWSEIENPAEWFRNNYDVKEIDEENNEVTLNDIDEEGNNIKMFLSLDDKQLDFMTQDSRETFNSTYSDIKGILFSTFKVIDEYLRGEELATNCSIQDMRHDIPFDSNWQFYEIIDRTYSILLGPVLSSTVSKESFFAALNLQIDKIENAIVPKAKAYAATAISYIKEYLTSINIDSVSNEKLSIWEKRLPEILDIGFEFYKGHISYAKNVDYKGHNKITKQRIASLENLHSWLLKRAEIDKNE